MNRTTMAGWLGGLVAGLLGAGGLGACQGGVTGPSGSGPAASIEVPTGTGGAPTTDSGAGNCYGCLWRAQHAGSGSFNACPGVLDQYQAQIDCACAICGAVCAWCPANTGSQQACQQCLDTITEADPCYQLGAACGADTRTP